MFNQIIKIVIRKELEYKVDFCIKFFMSMIPVLITVLVWRSVYIKNNKQLINNISYYEMIAYIMVTNIVFEIIKIERFDIAEEIKTGSISGFLLKPINYLFYKLQYYCVRVLVNITSYFIPLFIIFILTINNYSDVFFFFVLLTEAAIIRFLITYILSLLTFWFFNVSGFFYVINIIISFLAGTLVPLEFLPTNVSKIFSCLPFRYLGYECGACLYLKKEVENQFVSIAEGGLWIILLFFVGKWIWKCGLERFDAYGG